jgi:hypothetical protein
MANFCNTMHLSKGVGNGKKTLDTAIKWKEIEAEK